MHIKAQQVANLIIAKYDLSEQEAISALEMGESFDMCNDVFKVLHDSMFGVKYGYSRILQDDQIATELMIDRLVSKIWGKGAKLKKQSPKIYLSHDIDYLWKTKPYSLKGIISERVFSFPDRSDHFLESIETLFRIDKKYIKSGEAGTCFIYAKSSPSNLTHSLAAWIMDPSYCLTDQEFSDLEAMIKKYRSHIGIHGSYFAWSYAGLFTAECQALTLRAKEKIISHRAHWLNIRSLNDFMLMYDAGIRIDSSMGFNGTAGFRGGMARCFHFQINENKSILEVPLLAMDGPLYQSRHKRNEVAIEKLKTQLALVAEVGGSISFDWHDRSAHRDYSWVDLYEELLEYSLGLGFEFLNMRDLEREI